MDWTLRKAVPDDRPRIEELFIEMLQTIYQRPDVQGYEPGYLDKFFLDRGDWICVADAGGEVIGFLSIEEHREERVYLYLDDCSVGKEYRNRGIGTALIGAAERYAAERKIPALLLHVERSNPPARRLYQRLGFGIIEEEASRFLMAKRIINEREGMPHADIHPHR